MCEYFVEPYTSQFGNSWFFSLASSQNMENLRLRSGCLFAQPWVWDQLLRMY